MRAWAYVFLFGLSLVAAVISYAITPLARRLTLRAGIIAQPNARRIHKTPIPQGAGIAIYVAFWCTAWLLFAGIPRVLSPALGSVFIGSTILIVLGLLDDKYELRPALKLLGQLAAVAYVVIHGHRIDFITNPLGGMLYLGNWGIPLTILWITAIINMVNFSDGLDGLAAGVSGIACIPLAIVAMQMGRYNVAFLTVILAGSIVGFLPYNFNPARVFMGDTGAMFLGFMLGVITVDGALKGAAAIALTVPFLALGVPAFDTAFAIIRRTCAGRPFYEADKGHLHHRLLALGYSQKQTAYALYALSGLLGVAAILAVDLSGRQATLLFMFVALAIGLLAQRVGALPSLHHRHRSGR